MCTQGERETERKRERQSGAHLHYLDRDRPISLLLFYDITYVRHRELGCERCTSSSPKQTRMGHIVEIRPVIFL